MQKNPMGARPGEQACEKIATESLARPRIVDRYLPIADIVESRHILVNAPPDATYAALRQLNFADVPSLLLRGVMALHLRALRRARQRLGLSPLPVPERLTFDNLESYGRILLGEEPGREIVVGAIVRPWDVESALERRTPAEFVAFDCPGHIKGAASFVVTPYGARQTLLSYESRARATDTATRRTLFAIDKVTAPLSGFFMQRLLDHVRNVTERTWRGCSGQTRASL